MQKRATFFHLRFRFEQKRIIEYTCLKIDLIHANKLKLKIFFFFAYFLHGIIPCQFETGQNSGILEKFSKLDFLERDVSNEKMSFFVPRLFLHVKLLGCNISYMIRIYVPIFYILVQYLTI